MQRKSAIDFSGTILEAATSLNPWALWEDWWNKWIIKNY